MPIKDKDFGKYKRPDIFIEEIDSSVIELPIQDVLINLVPGFSKKGPFNAPIYVTNPNDFTSIFGEDDRRLENKGSFFHKTCKQMLKSGPVWALNLLATDPNRDKVDWQSISVSAQYENSEVKRSAYEYFFNRQSFWERDTESFLNVVKSNNYGVQDDERLFHITNMSDRDITVFMFKSDITGFDVTAEEWYGDRTKVPLYIDYREMISDYLVSVVVVAGDWSDYSTLSNDETFQKYFNKNGLIKTEVDNFLAERTVTILANYDCSLIPYFKDLNNRDMYIKNVINNNTDKTGLFCTYNENSLLEADFKLGNLDIVGDVLVGQDISSIKFMSYETTLKNTQTYTQKYLDSSNNVFTNNRTAYSAEKTVAVTGSTNYRSGIYTNGHTYKLSVSLSGLSHTGLTIDGATGAYFVLNGSIIDASLTYPVTMSALTSGQYTRYNVIYLDSDNNVNVLYGEASTSPTIVASKPEYLYSLDSTLIVGYVLQSGTTVKYTPVTIGQGNPDSDQYIPISLSLSEGTDYLRIQFSGVTSTIDYTNYNQLRGLYAYNEMSDNISTESVLIKLGSTGTTFEQGEKMPVTEFNLYPGSSTSYAHVDLYVDIPLSGHTGNTLLLYYTDDEFLINANKKTGRLVTSYQDLNVVSSTEFYTDLYKGVVAQYSAFYQDYYNGNIDSSDYFYINNTTGSTGTKVYLNMWLDQDELLTVDFEDNNGTRLGVSNWDSSYQYHLDIHSDKSNWKQSVEIVSWVGDDLTTCQEIVVNRDRYSEITRGSYLAAYYDEDNWEPGGAGYLEGSVPRKLTRITKVKNDPNDDTLKTLYTDAPIKIFDANLSGQTGEPINYQTFTYPTIDAYVDEYKALKISPFVVHTDSIPDGTDTRQNSILNVISKDTNLAKALADKNKISWRYLVDSFGLGLEPVDGFGSKQQLADLCGMKLNSLGFLNMPSAKIFTESTNPSFTNDDGTLNLEYVKQGADETKNPDYYYQFAQLHGTIDGRSCVGYFFPYVKIYDNGIPKYVPPSSYVATTYMQKFVSNVAGMLPWTICAGITNGRVQGLTKTEMDFTNTDLENLHAMGANPIVYRVNNGYCINDESTAQVFPYSSLSFLHSREVLIELENKLYDMLLKYQWKFNTQEIRAEIKYKADKICKDMLDSDAFYDFWNVCDETNNTDYVIDLQMGVLDTYVEIIKGMGIIVNNITIMKKGDIQSMGFK